MTPPNKIKILDPTSKDYSKNFSPPPKKNWKGEVHAMKTCVLETATHLFPCEYCKNFKTPILKNICKQLLVTKALIVLLLSLYQFKLTKHSHFLIFTTLHANSATKIKENGGISYNSNVTTCS